MLIEIMIAPLIILTLKEIAFYIKHMFMIKKVKEECGEGLVV
jgi:hypothetical protein